MKGRPIAYTPDELAFIQALSALPRELIHAEVVAMFGRTELTVDHIRQVCIRHGWLTRERWTAAEDAQLRAQFADTETRTLAAALGRSLTTTYQRAYALGLTKSAAYLASPTSGRIRRGERRGTATEFRPGHVPANKGLRRKGWAPGRMATTQFAAGVPSWRHQAIGSTRVVEGYEFTKVAMTPRVAWTRNWKQTHLLRWEAEHGPVPAGHALKCLDGNRLNTDPSNWIAVPRALLPLLNGGRMKRRPAFDAAPLELKPTLLAMARLTHAAGKRRKVAA